MVAFISLDSQPLKRCWVKLSSKDAIKEKTGRVLLKSATVTFERGAIQKLVLVMLVVMLVLVMIVFFVCVFNILCYYCVDD